MNVPPIQPGWNCPNCGVRLEPFRDQCYACGYSRKPMSKGRGNMTIIVIGLVVVLLAALGFCGGCMVTMGAPGAMAGARSPQIQSGETFMMLAGAVGLVGMVVIGAGLVSKK